MPPGPGQTRPDETGENRRGHSKLVRPTCAKKQLHRGGDDTKTIVMSRGPRGDVLLLSWCLLGTPVPACGTVLITYHKKVTNSVICFYSRANVKDRKSTILKYRH